MNLNEVKKHVVFHLLIYIGIGLCLFLSLLVILATPTKAMEQTTDITSSIRTNFDCPWGYNASGYCAIQTNNSGGVRSFNTRYNGVLNSIGLAFPYYFNANGNSQQIIDIYSTTNDFRNNNINVYCYSYETSPSQSTVRSCSLRFISQKHIQVVFPYDSLQWHEIILASNNAITGVSNYLIQKVTLTYDDGQQDLGGIIDNATSNTTDIINNSNANAQETQNVIFNSATSIINELADRCNNLIDMNKFISSVLCNNSGSACNNGGSISSISNESGSLSFNTPGAWAGVLYQDYLDVSDYDLYLNFDSSGYFLIKVSGYDSNFNYISQTENYGKTSLRLCSDPNVSVCNSLSVKYVRFSIEITTNNNFTISNARVNTNNSAFCPFGSTISKLDIVENFLGLLHGDNTAIEQVQEEMKDIQQDTYDYLTDNSDPSVNSTGISNVMNSVQISDPLNYLLTLPINLLQKLNTTLSANSCSRVSFGTLYNTELYLPCINFEQILGSTIWGTIDLIVGVGLLAIIFKRFYDSISNVLTLGKEKEVRDKLDLPTPMQFLASILGGGRD